MHIGGVQGAPYCVPCAGADVCMRAQLGHVQRHCGSLQPAARPECAPPVPAFMPCCGLACQTRLSSCYGGSLTSRVHRWGTGRVCRGAAPAAAVRRCWSCTRSARAGGSCPTCSCARAAACPALRWPCARPSPTLPSTVHARLGFLLGKPCPATARASDAQRAPW